MEAATTPCAEQPAWLQSHRAKQQGNPTWVKGGPSPNPSGRPKGIVDKRSKVAQALADDAPAVARVVIDAALEGDMQAASLVLSRVAPSLRSQTQTVTFDFDAGASVGRQVEQVLAAIASGEVAPDVGKQIIDAIQALSAIRAVEDLEKRIIDLEAKS